MKDTPLRTLSDAFMMAEEEMGHVMKGQLANFLKDAKGLSQRGREALIDVYATDTKRAVIDGYLRAMNVAAERIERGNLTGSGRAGGRRRPTPRAPGPA